jgi:hypothetical protein
MGPDELRAGAVGVLVAPPFATARAAARSAALEAGVPLLEERPESAELNPSSLDPDPFDTGENEPEERRTEFGGEELEPPALADDEDPEPEADEPAADEPAADESVAPVASSDTIGPPSVAVGAAEPTRG